MKKFISITLLIALIALTALTAFGCGKKEVPLKTGLGVVTSFSKSSEASADGEGVAQADITFAAVLVGDDGVIDSCAFDTVQSKVNFTTEGTLTTPLSATFLSKQELGDAYNMKIASSIGKEWFEQANALAAFVKGKTMDQVKALADDTGYAINTDLTASVTMSIGGYIQALEKAVASATHTGAKQGDKLTLNSMTGIPQSKDASDDADGVAQAYTTIGVITLDSGNVITSCLMDAVQANVKFNKQGVITSDLSAPVKTKVELGPDYGMKVASSIGKEWFEQASALTASGVGKKVTEASAMSLTPNGTPADLTASVTITVNEFIEILKKAAK